MNLHSQELVNVLEEAKSLEERAINIKKEALRLQVRKQHLRDNVVVVDLKDQKLGIIINSQPSLGFFKYRMIDCESVRTSYFKEYDVRMATEEEITEYYTYKTLNEVFGDDKRLQQQQYIHIAHLGRTAKVIGFKGDKEVVVAYIHKNKAHETILESTNMEHYFVRQDTISTDYMKWHTEKEANIDLFNKKVEEIKSLQK